MDTEALVPLAKALAATDFGRWAHGAGYPIVNLVHLLGLVLLLGGISIVDLRIIGAFRAVPLPELAAALTPLAVAGLVLLGLSGATLFIADGTTLLRSATFGWKLAAIALALANAALFRAKFKVGAAMPAGARLLAAVSLAAWLTVATLGRMIAYNA